MNPITRLLRIDPQPTPDGAFSPSKLSLAIATSPVTDYERVARPRPCTGDRTVLVVCTEQRNMTMKNGKQFSTGNHPVETLVPIMHLRDAGFGVTIVTPTGQPVALEMWAMPEKDADVRAALAELQDQFDNPESLEKIIDALDPDGHAALFIPGGHGAMLGLPTDDNVRRLLHWAHDNDLFTLSICHGPAALLADPDDLYSGYQIAAFPDLMDRILPTIGYLPGPMPWYFGEKLTKRGLKIVNRRDDDTVCTDRRLITGASPKAAHDFGVVSAETLLQRFSHES